MDALSDTICIRPDGRHCLHPESMHITKPHPLVAGPWGCVDCWLASDCELIGPYVHAWNPHILTEAGWLPVGVAA